MPRLPFVFFSKATLFSCSAAKTQNRETPATSTVAQTPATVAHLDTSAPALNWASIDFFETLRQFYEDCSAEQVSMGFKTTTLPSSGAVHLTELSTAELTARVLQILLHLHCEGGTAGAGVSASSCAIEDDVAAAAASIAPHNVSVQSRFVQSLRRLIAAQRTVAQFLQGRTIGLGGEDSAKSMACVLTEAAMHLGKFVDGSFPMSRELRKTSRGAPAPQCQPSRFPVGITEAFTRVISTNLYTISSLLEALEGDHDFASASPSRRTDRERVRDAVCPCLFYLITLTLDMAAAASCFTAEQPSSTVSGMSSLPCVLQQEGSHVLACLLHIQSDYHRLEDADRERRSDATPTTACCWVVTHNLLRRLQPLLFTALSEVNDAKRNDSEQRMDGVLAILSSLGGVCDCTDVSLVVWMADCLRRYTDSALPKPQQECVADLRDGPATSRTFLSPFSVCGSLPFSKVHEGFQYSCLLELLRCLSQRLRKANSFSGSFSATSSSTENSETLQNEKNAANPHAYRTAGNILSATRFIEYASVLSPTLETLHASAVWRMFPPPLREVVNELRIELHCFRDAD